MHFCSGSGSHVKFSHPADAAQLRPLFAFRVHLYLSRNRAGDQSYEARRIPFGVLDS